MTIFWLLLGVLLGSLSPLLTFARLFQMKEWRWDRLREHLRREGWITSLIGKKHAAIIMLYTLLIVGVFVHMVLIEPTFLSPFGIIIVTADFLIMLLGVALFALLSCGTMALGRQQYPRWTAKTMLLVATAFTLTSILTYYCAYGVRVLLLPYIVVAQPAMLILSSLLWKPIDTSLKRRLLARAARHRATFTNATVIGIVGSVGKTTTKELLACVLQDLSPFATPEHVNTELGVASWLLRIKTTSQSPLLIIEMGAYRAGEIATLCRVAQPTIGVVTALGSDHLALFGSEEAIIAANAEIISSLPANGHLFLLSDSAATRELRSIATGNVKTAGSADAQNIRESDRGLTFESGGNRFSVALHGMHNVGNVLLAIAVARHFHIPEERIRESLAHFRGSAHTFHVKRERGITILDDTYNVSPLSFRAALAWAQHRFERPRVLLTSGLLETGSTEQQFLRDLGQMAKKSVERVVFTTTNGSDAFADTFGPVEILSPDTQPLPDDGLLLCVGRMPPHTVQRLLPRMR